MKLRLLSNATGRLWRQALLEPLTLTDELKTLLSRGD